MTVARSKPYWVNRLLPKTTVLGLPHLTGWKKEGREAESASPGVNVEVKGLRHRRGDACPVRNLQDSALQDLTGSLV